MAASPILSESARVERETRKGGALWNRLVGGGSTVASCRWVERVDELSCEVVMLRETKKQREARKQTKALLHRPFARSKGGSRRSTTCSFCSLEDSCKSFTKAILALCNHLIDGSLDSPGQLNPHLLSASFSLSSDSRQQCRQSQRKHEQLYLKL